MPETTLFGYCPASGAEPVTDELTDPRVAGRTMALSLVFDAVDGTFQLGRPTAFKDGGACR
jgi:hypothetical protein